MSLTPEDFGLSVEDGDEREIRFAKQRKERGWDDSETWCLVTSLTNWMLPRLKRFRELTFGYPGCVGGEDEWNDILDKIIKAFQLIKDNECHIFDEAETKEVDDGLDLFREYFFALWW